MVWWNEGVFDTTCWRLVSLGLNFTCQKYTTIKDWRVGLLHRLLQAAVVVYVLYQFFTLKSYLEIESPNVVFQTLGTGGADFYPALNQALNDPPYYCTKDARYTAFLPARPDQLNITPRCSDVDWPLLVESSGQDSVFVETFRMETVTRSIYNVSSLEFCPPASIFPTGEGGDFAQARGPFFKAKANACTYKLVKHDIPLVPEYVAVGFGFSYLLSPRFKAGGTSKDMNCMLKGTSDELIMASVAENKLYIQAPLYKWLDQVGVSLDKDIGQLGNEEITSLVGVLPMEQGLPMTRTTGMTLNIDVKLYNEGLQPYGYANEEGIACIVQVKPTLFWRNGPTSIYKIWNGDSTIGFGSIETFGVLITFSGSGSFGALSLTLAINTLVAGLVLLSVAEIVAMFVAAFLLGVRSQIYEKFIYEKVDYMREFARYACQCLVAAELFKSKDADHSGTLGRDEIFCSLHGLFAEYLDGIEIAALTDFIMKTKDRTDTTFGSDDNQIKSVLGFLVGKSNKSAADVVTLEEWLNCFTQDICSLKSLHDIIHSEYNTKKKLEAVSSKTMSPMRAMEASRSLDATRDTDNVFLSISEAQEAKAKAAEANSNSMDVSNASPLQGDQPVE